MRRFILVLALTMFAALLAPPAQACGCGIYIPHDGASQVDQERVILRWDGKTEDILMSLGVLGQAQDAAVILPLPARADLKLGDLSMFTELEEYTRPRVEQTGGSLFGVGASAPMPAGAPVIVVERKQLGPFDVSNLRASDTTALGDWLKANGYNANFSPTLAKALDPYAAQGWYFVAVRLQPSEAGKEIGGNLDPIWATFPSDKLVYPMRPSANAKTPQTVTLYVLADHRVEKAQSFGSSDLQFANWVEPAEFGSDSRLKPLVTRKWFLTKYEDRVSPERVNDDFVFTFAAKDDPFQIVEYEGGPDGNLTLLYLVGILCVLGTAGLAFLGLVFFIARRMRSKPGAA